MCTAWSSQPVLTDTSETARTTLMSSCPWSHFARASMTRWASDFSTTSYGKHFLRSMSKRRESRVHGQWIPWLVGNVDDVLTGTWGMGQGICRLMTVLVMYDRIMMYPTRSRAVAIS